MGIVRAQVAGAGRPQRAPRSSLRVVQLRRLGNRSDSVVRRFENPADREVAGFCAAALAFGRVASVLQSIERLLAVMGRSPAAFVRAFDPRRQARDLKPLVHRWTKGDDLTALDHHPSADADEGIDRGVFSRGVRSAGADMSGALESFSTRAMQTNFGPRTAIARRVRASPTSSRGRRAAARARG